MGDTNYDGLVSRESFSKLVDKAASIPRAHGYAPPDSELYKTEEERDLARKKMFDSMDLKSTGVITFDEWYRFSMEHIAAKTPPLLLTPSLTMAARSSTWSSSRRLPMLPQPRTWRCTGSWWRSSLMLTATRMASLPRGRSPAWLVNSWRLQSSTDCRILTRT